MQRKLSEKIPLFYGEQLEAKALDILNKANAITPVATMRDDEPSSFQVAGNNKIPYTVVMMKNAKVYSTQMKTEK